MGLAAFLKGKIIEKRDTHPKGRHGRIKMKSCLENPEDQKWEKKDEFSKVFMLLVYNYSVKRV